MSLLGLEFPIVALADSRPGHESWQWFADAEDFATCESWRLDIRLGMLVADSGGRCWSVSAVRDLGVTGSLLVRVLRFLVRQSLHRLDYDLVALPDTNFDAVKSRFCAAIQSNPDYWRDDEAIAGEDGPPREEQDLLNEMKAAVSRSNSVPELIGNLWEEDVSAVLAARLDRRRRSEPSRKSGLSES